MDSQEKILQLLIGQIEKRIFEESIPRIKKCLDLITEAEVWQRPNQNSNSIGNLILHLCGNVRQWLIAGLGKQTDVRERNKEFEEKGPILKTILIDKLAALEADAREVMKSLKPEDLTAIRPVQCYEETGIGIIIHVIEHFSYHTGQITFFVKALKDVDTGYYADQELEKTGEEKINK